MTDTAAHEVYGTPVWGPGPRRAGPAWTGEAFWRPPFNGRLVWIAMVVLGFIAWWPIGLAILFYLIGSGRMGCRRYRHQSGAQRDGAAENRPGWAGPWSGWRRFCGDERAAQSSGNRAFDEYRADALHRLEEEQREFAAFLDRLRFAKDKAEFDAFMTERRQRPEPPAEPTPG